MVRDELRTKTGPADMTQLGVFTCSVYPDLTRVWYHILSRTLKGRRPTTLIFDCGGGLRREWLPGADTRRVPNWDHGRKIDLALHEFRSADVVLILDDDVFPLSWAILRRGIAALEANNRMAVYSLHYRDWWRLPAAHGLHVPMGSYALLVRPEIIQKEGLSFRSVKTGDPAIRNGSGYWDTADYCQKELLERGYTIGYASEEDRLDIPTFFGTSSAFLNFARRSILSDRYVRRGSRRRWERAVLSNVYGFQRGCSVAAVVDVFQRLLHTRPSFLDWFSEGDLRGLALALPDVERRQEYAATADRIFGIRDRLLTA